jgi:threonine/homoserine/homoserine lactone efflux protein
VTAPFSLIDQPFLVGAFVSLSVAVPIGPIALICIRRTLSDGLGTGVASGVGVATVHFCYGSLALSGGSAIGEFLCLHQAAARLFGGIVVILLAIRSLLRGSAPAKPADTAARAAILTSYTTTCLLAFSNPMTVLGLAAGLSTFGLFGAGLQWPISIGMFCGSTAWWIILCGASAALRCSIGAKSVQRINRGGCAVMTCLGFSSIARALC